MFKDKPVGDRITVRMSPAMLAMIDAWIAAQPGYVSRQEAVRRCVEMVLLNRELPTVDGLEHPHAEANREDDHSVDQEVVYLDV